LPAQVPAPAWQGLFDHGRRQAGQSVRTQGQRPVLPLLVCPQRIDEGAHGVSQKSVWPLVGSAVPS